MLSQLLLKQLLLVVVVVLAVVHLFVFLRLVGIVIQNMICHCLLHLTFGLIIDSLCSCSSLRDELFSFRFVFHDKGLNESTVDELTAIPTERSHTPAQEHTLEQEVQWEPREEDVREEFSNAE